MFREIIFRKWDIVAIHSVFCIPFPKCWTLVIAFIGLLVTTNNITSFVAPLSVKGFLVYSRLEKLHTAISSAIDVSNKFVDWKCFEAGRWLMDAFSLNYFIRCRQVHSNNRWHKFHGSIRKLFWCMEHNLAQYHNNFRENYVFDCSTYVIRWDFVMVSFTLEPAQWLIQGHCSY